MLYNLHKNYQLNNSDKTVKFIQHRVHNYSSYILSRAEEKVLSFRLDQQIPTICNRNKLFMEFETFYHSILKDISHIPVDDITRLKTKLCHTYSQIQVPYQYCTVINNLHRNKNLAIPKQDKGRRIVILDKNKYIEKCISIVMTDKFKKIDNSPTATCESKVQRILRKMKFKFTEREYYQLYPTGSNAGKFYDTAKVHKLKQGDTVDHLPLRPVVSNCGTASYKLAKYLTKLLSPLSKSQYTVQSTKELINHIKKQKVPSSYKMISFNVILLFTNVSRDATIDIILKRIYERKEINTSFTKQELKELILLCTKVVHFTLCGESYIQIDEVATGSPVGSVLSGIFTVELANTLVPTPNHLLSWKRYVDNTNCFIKEDSIEHVMSVLNAFHLSIHFIYETI